MIQEDDLVDLREIDQVIIEMGGMVGRWNLFKKFLLDSFNEHTPDDSPAQSSTASLPLESTASQKAFDNILHTFGSVVCPDYC